MSRHYEMITEYDNSVGAIRIKLRGTLPNGAMFTGERVIDARTVHQDMIADIKVKHRHDLERSFNECCNKFLGEVVR